MSEKNKDGGGNAPAPWQDEFKLRADLKQRDIYAFEKSVHALGGFVVEGSNILADHALKAAIDAGWLADPASEVLQTAAGDKRYHLDAVDVDDLHPGKVRWYGLRVMGHYSESVKIPPN